VVKARRWRYKT